MLISLLGIREVVIDLLVEDVEDDIQKVPSKQKTIFITIKENCIFYILFANKLNLGAM